MHQANGMLIALHFYMYVNIISMHRLLNV